MLVLNMYTIMQHNNLHIKLSGKRKNAVLTVNEVKSLLKT